MPDGMAPPGDDPRVPVLLRQLRAWTEFVSDGSACDILAAIDAVDPLRGPTKELKDKHPVVLYFGTREDAAGFAAAVSVCFDRPVMIKL